MRLVMMVMMVMMVMLMNMYVAAADHFEVVHVPSLCWNDYQHKEPMMYTKII